jgi:predicted site-specific integrase-resolvase
MARIGYARVSTIDQDLEIQIAKLRAESCDIVRSEKVSGVSREGRAELQTVIQFLRPADELVVTRLDRLGRDTRDVLNLIHECEQRKAFVTVLDPHVSTRGEMGHIVLTVLGMVAQMERRFIKERQREGITQAKVKADIRVENVAWTPSRFCYSPRKVLDLLKWLRELAARGCRFTAFLLRSSSALAARRRYRGRFAPPDEVDGSRSRHRSAKVAMLSGNRTRSHLSGKYTENSTRQHHHLKLLQLVAYGGRRTSKRHCGVQHRPEH